MALYRSPLTVTLWPSAFLKKRTKNQKSWKAIGNLDHFESIPRYLERAEAPARFRLITGHDFLGVYLHWLGLSAEVVCPQRGHARMDEDHLLQCRGLEEHLIDDVTNRSW
ncbi:reverse transcriptase [Trichonephila clavipes]|nr:reverse transcriptase [Trichonephila clavipes]